MSTADPSFSPSPAEYDVLRALGKKQLYAFRKRVQTPRSAPGRSHAGSGPSARVASRRARRELSFPAPLGSDVPSQSSANENRLRSVSSLRRQSSYEAAMHVQVVPLGETDLSEQASPLQTASEEKASKSVNTNLLLQNQKLESMLSMANKDVAEAREVVNRLQKELSSCKTALQQLEERKKSAEVESAKEGASVALGKAVLESSERLQKERDRQHEMERLRMEVELAKTEAREATRLAEVARKELGTREEEFLKLREVHKREGEKRDEQIEKLQQIICDRSQKQRQEQKIQKLREIHRKEIADRNLEIETLHNRLALADREHKRSSQIVEEQNALIAALRKDIVRPAEKVVQGPSVQPLKLKVPGNATEARNYVMARAHMRKLNMQGEQAEEEDDEGCLIS